MCKEKRSAHLNEEALLRIVVDSGDASPAEKEHLGSCLFCRREVERLSRSLDLLGARARAVVPEVPVRPVWEIEEKARFGFRWRSVPFRLWAAGLAAAAVVVLFLWGMGLFHGPVVPMRTPAVMPGGEEMSVTSIVPEEEEDLLPERLARLAEHSSVLSEAFLDFVAPFGNGQKDVLPGLEGGVS